jgi:hypothetical protein
MMGHSSGSSLPSPWGPEKQRREFLMLQKMRTSLHWRYLCHRLCKGQLCKDPRVVCQYEMKNFCPNLKRLIKNKMMKTGPFMVPANKESLSPWYASSKKTSLAYTLLHYMYRFNSTKINRMTAEDIWKLHPQFQQYLLKDFKRYNKNMKHLVTANEMRAAAEDAIFLENMQHHPQKQITCRGTPFWSKHAAKNMLKGC